MALAASAGLRLDDWQQFVLEHALGERADGKWAAREVGVVVPRQNGKGAVIEALCLAALFLFDLPMTLCSAHEFKTAKETYLRVRGLIKQTPYMDKVCKFRYSNEDVSIERTDTGQRLRFVARSKGSGRGFSGGLVILDEAYDLPDEVLAALMPTLSAQPNPQMWYLSSAGLESSEQLARVRERGKAGGGRLAYFEWSAEDGADLDDPAAWAQANPALGIRITAEAVESERAAMPEVNFARERLGIWDDPRKAAVIAPEVWAALTDRESRVAGAPVFAVDVTPERTSASVGIVGRRADGSAHLEVLDPREGREGPYPSGTLWVAERVAAMVKRRRPLGPVMLSDTARTLLPRFEELGVEVEVVQGANMAQACGQFYDAVQNQQLRHLSDARLNVAVDVARKRPLGDLWAWHRRDVSSDISPLVAVTVGLFGLEKYAAAKPKSRAAFGF